MNSNIKPCLLDRVIVALDQMTANEVEHFLNENSHSFPKIKIGMELYYKLGKDWYCDLVEKYGPQVFLDLKLHDIPETVERALKSLLDLPFVFLTLHLSGGLEMIKRAMNIKNKLRKESKLLGVTYLTSLSTKDLSSLWPTINDDNYHFYFERMLNLAIESEIDGIILSPKDLLQTHRFLESKKVSLLKICPGIRFQDEILNGQLNDQKRVMDPLNAIKNGADYLVMGRSITQTIDPLTRINWLKNTFI